MSHIWKDAESRAAESPLPKALAISMTVLLNCAPIG